MRAVLLADDSEVFDLVCPVFALEQVRIELAHTEGRLLAEAADAESGTSSFGYDALERLTRVQAPSTGLVRYGYAPAGQRAAFIYPDGSALNYQYWSDGQIRAVLQGSTTLASYGYDSAGRLRSITRSNGAGSSYSYDGADRLTALQSTDGGVTITRFSYRYDRSGQTTSAAEALAQPPAVRLQPGPTSDTVALPRGWSLLSEPLVPTTPLSASVVLSGLPRTTGGSVAALYQLVNGSWSQQVLDNAGSISGPDFALQPGVAYELYADTAGHYTFTGSVPASPPNWTLASVWDVVGITLGATTPLSASTVLRALLGATGGSVVALYQQTANGSWSSPVLDNGGSITGTDFVLQPGTGYLLDTDTETTFAPYSSYGARTVSYSYDGAQRLTGATENPGNTYSYAYDAAGNRTSVAVNGTTTANSSYDAADQVVGWTYDAAGNLTSDGSTTYSYDALNQLTGTSASGQTRGYTYNGDGTLVRAVANGVTTSYAQDLAGDQSQVVASTSGGVTTDYLLDATDALLGSVSGSTRTWYGIDGQGSIRQTLDDAGDVTSTQSYDSYGQVEAGSTLSTTFGYAGQLQDPTTGSEYLRARWYQPNSATLLGVDPALESTGQPYAYAADDPVNGSDPSGDCTFAARGKTFTINTGGNGSCTADVLRDFLFTGASAGVAKQAVAQLSEQELMDRIGALLSEEATNGVGSAQVEPLDPGQGTAVTAAEQEQVLEAAQAGRAIPLVSGLAEGIGALWDVVVPGCAAAAGLISAPAVVIGVAVVAAVGGTYLVVSESVNPAGATIGEVPAQPNPTPGTPTPTAPSGGIGTDQDQNKPQRILFHYTDLGGFESIPTSSIKPSMTGNFGAGIYLTSLPPNEVFTARHYSWALYRNPARTDRVAYYFAINVSNLPIKDDGSIYSSFRQLKRHRGRRGGATVR